MQHECSDDIPCLPQPSQPYTGAFRDNVREFLSTKCNVVPDLDQPRTSGWLVDLCGSPSSLRLHVYEERVDEQSPTVCDSCRIVGWQHHAVCTRRYHFIIPARMLPEAARDAGNLAALVENQAADPSHKPLAALLHPAQLAQEAMSPYTAPASVFDAHSHLLHGVLHANGFGHLLRINGLEGGSKDLTGSRIMDIWDSLCHMLRARQVSVEDVSNKCNAQGGMELRVLHVAAWRTTWYGRWNYAFGRGGFGISKAAWRRAAESVCRAPLAAVLDDFGGSDPGIDAIALRYQGGGGQSAGAATLGELLQRMLHLLSRPDEAARVVGTTGTDPEASLAAGPGSGQCAGVGLQAVSACAEEPGVPRTGQPGSMKRKAPGAQPGGRSCQQFEKIAEAEHSCKRQRSAELPQEVLAAQLTAARGQRLPQLQGRWWKKRWSGERSRAVLSRVLTALQSAPGQWHSAAQVRQKLHHAVESGLVEHVLKAVGNHCVDGWMVFRDAHPETLQDYFMVEAEPQAPPPVASKVVGGMRPLAGPAIVPEKKRKLIGTAMSARAVGGGRRVEVAGQPAGIAKSPLPAPEQRRMEVSARQLRSAKSRFPPCPTLDKSAEAAVGLSSKGLMAAAAVLASASHPDAAQGLQAHAGVQAPGTVQPARLSEAAQTLAAKMPRPAAKQQPQKRKGRLKEAAVSASQPSRSGRLQSGAAAPALSAQVLPARSKPGAQSSVPGESAAPQAEKLRLQRRAPAGAESPGGAHLLISGRRSTGLQPGQAAEQKPSHWAARQGASASGRHAAQGARTTGLAPAPCTAPSRLLRHTGQVSYSEGGARKRAREEAAARREGSTLRSQPRALLTMRFPWHCLSPGARFTAVEGLQPRDQVMRDLAHFFDSVLRSYRPAVAAAAAAQVPSRANCTCAPQRECPHATCRAAECAAPAVTADRLCLPHMNSNAQVLRDVKHFVKDYQGEQLQLISSGPTAARAASAGRREAEGRMPGMARLMVQVQMPDAQGQDAARAAAAGAADLQPGADAGPQRATAGRDGGRVAARRRPVRRRVLAGPPAELLVVPQRMGMPALRKAAGAALRDIYKIFERFQVERMEGLSQAGQQSRARLESVPHGTVVTLHGSGIDPGPQWRHAGGAEEWLVACTCGTRDDDGERMITCDSCGLWSHTRCAGYPDDEPLPEHFVCTACSHGSIVDAGANVGLPAMV